MLGGMRTGSPGKMKPHIMKTSLADHALAKWSPAVNSALLTALLPILVLGSVNAARADDSPANFMRTWAEAWQTSDVDKVMTFYDAAEETTAIESLGHIRRGPAEIRKMYRGAFDELIFDRVRLTPITEGQHGSVAWGTYHYKADIRLKSDNTRYVLEVRGSFVMKKQDGSWKISLEHFSTIPDVPRVRPATE
jgi:ketosteroid isomerase-like protein